MSQWKNMHPERWTEAYLSFIVAGVVAMMIIPVPTWLLDILIAANLGVSVILLLTAIYVSEPLGFATFPTVLLFTTLYRLGLNVSSTRLILLQADAGRVIDSFGSFVVAGDYIVGAVVFIILALIQFLVIARGSHRVAEVAARFTLDAMPGKQLAIDSDLRTGLIGRDEARTRRKRIEREGQFYGAMDGAMKFVKGDAIAALVIVAIDITGGTLIGIFRNGMSVVEALQVYGLLTVGDGLVSQIPALVISTAAGLIVTRVAAEEAGSMLGVEIRKQLFSQPKAIFTAAILLFALGVIPGLPLIPFFILGAILLAVAWGFSRIKDGADAGSSSLFRDASIISENESITLEISQDNVRKLGLDQSRMEEITMRSRDRAEEYIGVEYPAIIVNYDTLKDDTVLFFLSIRGIRFPAPGCLTAQKMEDTAALETALTDMLLLRADQFAGIEETRKLVISLEKKYPHLTEELLSRRNVMTRLSTVLKNLVREGVSIRDFRGIAEAFLEVDDEEMNVHKLTEEIRILRKAWITDTYCDDDGVLRPLVLSPDIESTLVDSLRPCRTGEELAAAPELVARIEECVNESFPGKRPLIMTRPPLRRPLRDLLASKWPQTVVISTEEIEPGTKVSPTGVVEYT